MRLFNYLHYVAQFFPYKERNYSVRQKLNTIIQPMTSLRLFPYPIHAVACWSGSLPQVSRSWRSCAYLELIKYACDLWTTDSRKDNQQDKEASWVNPLVQFSSPTQWLQTPRSIPGWVHED